MCEVSKTVVRTLSQYETLERKELFELLSGTFTHGQLKNVVRELLKYGSIESVCCDDRRGKIYRATGIEGTKVCLGCSKEHNAWLINDDGVCGYCRKNGGGINRNLLLAHPLSKFKCVLPVGYVWQLINKQQKELKQ